MEALVLRSLRFSSESWRLGLARWRERAGERRRVRAAQRELAGLGQHELNDLGVGGSELPYWLAVEGSDAHTGADHGRFPGGELRRRMTR